VTWVPVCNGCGGAIDVKAWPRVAVIGQPSIRVGGPVKLDPGEHMDWCPPCTTVAFTAVRDFKGLVQAMRAAGLTGIEHNLGLQRYMADPLTPGEAAGLAQQGDRSQSVDLVQRYGHDGWRVARQAMLLMEQDRQAQTA
jgi:hypothetical protein